MDNGIFRPVKKSGVIAYQVRNERNGLGVELRNYDVTQGPCQTNVETSQTQAFWLETSGSYTYLVLADLPRLVVTVMPGSTYLTLTDKTFLPPNLVSRWQIEP